MRYTDYDQFADIYNRRWGGFARNVVEPLDSLGMSDLQPGAHLVDLCCGTGQLAATLSDRGLRVTGVDGSAEMIAFARENAAQAEFLVADAREFSVDQAAAMVVSTFDSLNHVMTQDGLVEVFRRVHDALEPSGRFVFDLNMDAGYRDRWRGSFVIDDNAEFIVVESSYRADEGIGEMKFTWFAAIADRWTRSQLTLTQRCYSVDEVTAALTAAGFGAIEVIDASDLVASWQSGRSFFSAHRPS